RWKNTLDPETLKIVNTGTVKKFLSATSSDTESVISTVSDTHQDTSTKEIKKLTGTYEIAELLKVGHDIEGDDSDQDRDMTSESELSNFEIEYETDKDNSQSQRNCVISGRCIINISYFFQQLKNISHKGAGLINQVFSFPLFSLISLNFMEVLLGIYLLTNTKTRNVSSIYWTTFYGIQLFCILIPPGAVEAQAKEISKYLAEAELQTDEDLLNERNHFLLRTLHQTIEFTACGFFPISTSAIIGQFSISISFLLFMFQIIK
ncbi:hypothetical protein RN001_002272, partial [Aquatica leii]